MAKKNHYEDGTIMELGPGQTKKMESFGSGNKNALEIAQKLNIGPKTKICWDALYGNHYGEKYGEMSYDWVANRVVEDAGLEGAKWLKEKGFSPSIKWLEAAIRTRRYDDLEGLKELGCDPHEPTDIGSLWHLMIGDWDEKVVSWLKKEGVDPTIPNMKGELPLERLMYDININANRDDFYGAGIGKMLMPLMNMMHQSGEYGDVLGEKAKGQKDLKRMKDLAKEFMQMGLKTNHKFFAEQTIAGQKAHQQGYTEQDFWGGAIDGTHPMHAPSLFGAGLNSVVDELAPFMQSPSPSSPEAAVTDNGDDNDAPPPVKKSAMKK